MTLRFTTPVGRLVQGQPYEANAVKNDDGTPKINKNGVPAHEFFVGIAFPYEPAGTPDNLSEVRGGVQVCSNWTTLHKMLKAEAVSGWSPKGIDPIKMTDFSWKIVDGNATDKYGEPRHKKNPAIKDHNVLRMTRNLSVGPVPMYCRSSKLPDGHPEKTDADKGPGAVTLIDVATAKQLFKRGYYCRAFGEYKSNDTTKYEGMYNNLEGIEFFGYGEEIIVNSGPSGEEMFGGDPVAPAGVTAAPAPNATDAATPAVPVQTASPTEAPAPYTGYADVPAPAAPTPAAPAPSGPQMTAKAGATPYEAFIAKGWTDDTLRANGYLV